MARFYGQLWGQAKSAASRIGGPSSGLHAHLRGWDIGVRVDITHDKQDEDLIAVSLTKGSNNPTAKPFALISRVDEGFRITLMKPNNQTETFTYLEDK